MIKVLGNDTERVKLTDLNDVVYYKQEKIYSDDDYNRSRDLKRNIENGRLTKLSDIKKENTSSDMPISVDPAPIENSSKIDNLLEYVKRLENKLNNISTPPVDNENLNVLIDRIKQLEEKIESSKGLSSIDPETLSIIKGLGEKIGSNSQLSTITSKIEELLSRAPGTIKEEDYTPTRPEDIYVPNITVEDTNAHINLKVRTIEKSDSVNDAAQALKNMKDKSK